MAPEGLRSHRAERAFPYTPLAVPWDAVRSGVANRRWAEDLATWRIPDEILQAAPESPWEFPPGLFEQRADASLDRWTPSNAAAWDALPDGGSVLDVGCGGGAASLPLAARAGRLVGVDVSGRLLAEYERRARDLVGDVAVLEGSWAEVAREAPVADVAVCHNVAYNVPELAAFVTELTRHARRRVVLELTRQHPMHGLNELWLRFHGLHRPDRPTAEDAEAVLREVGLKPDSASWVPDQPLEVVLDRRALVAWTRRRLCLPPERDAEVDAAIAEGGAGPARPMVTFWWAGAGS